MDGGGGGGVASGASRWLLSPARLLQKVCVCERERR